MGLVMGLGFLGPLDSAVGWWGVWYVEYMVWYFTQPPETRTKLKSEHLFKYYFKKMEPFEIEYICTKEYSFIERYYENPILLLKDIWSIVY